MKILNIETDFQGIFIKRPNRFLGIVQINNEQVQVHVHDPGRLKELLYPGNSVLIRKAHNINRKTKYDLIAAKFEDFWVLINSGFHRKIAEVFFKTKMSPFGLFKTIKSEVKTYDSRLDFLIEKKHGEKIYIETKGCTLAENGTALFPDAPTIRGVKHLNTLRKLKKEGFRSAAVILIFRPDSEVFMPKKDTDPLFAETFYKAAAEGIEIYPLLFEFSGSEVFFIKEISYK